MSAKRWLGTFNLYALGRRHHFDREVQRALVQHTVDLEPDVVVVSGDLTAQALPEEFEIAREALEPILERIPTLVLPGNHDVYTAGSAREKRFEAVFGPWAHREEGGLARLDLGRLTLLGLDPCRPHWSASGRIPDEQLAALAQTLASPSLSDRDLVLALHYPVLDRRGQLYTSIEHGLRNAADLVNTLKAAPRRPRAILHGHKHHGYRVDLDLGDVRVPIFNPGSGGYVYDARHDRAACMNVYELQGDVSVSRYRYDGHRFSTELPVAYASGQ
jgi:3',5'-cyclic AMP phosphodiesterase CpdA